MTVFVGAYGSGKSEISVNFALWQAQMGLPVTLCDLDIINPYFRSADARPVLTAAGVRLITPQFAGTNVDVPAVPSAAAALFDDRSRQAVLDIGGEDMGARVLASLRLKWLSEPVEPDVLLVVNPLRPFTQTAEQIGRVAAELMQAAQMRLTGLIHNANLQTEGAAELLTEHWPVVCEAAAALGLPVAFAAALSDKIPPGWGCRTPQGLPLLHLIQSIVYPG